MAVLPFFTRSVTHLEPGRDLLPDGASENRIPNAQIIAEDLLLYFLKGSFFSIREKVEFNQYWYSRKTIETLVDELLHLQQRLKPDGPLRVACLSTPSVYFTLTTAPEISDKLECWFFDFDPHLLQGERCVKFDYHEPKNVPVDLCHTFDCVLIDPPFITKEVWENYATTAKLLAASGAHFIGSSVRENGELLHELLEMISVPFQPSIPNLVYQYDFFTNYPPEGPFRHVNSEV